MKDVEPADMAASRDDNELQKNRATAIQCAITFLAKREYSRHELEKKLRLRNMSPIDINQALNRLVAMGLQDDRRFAESLIRTRSRAGYGPLYIRAELATHGITEAIIDTVLIHHEDDWTQIARDLFLRRFKPKMPLTLPMQRRAMALLARRGFSADTIRSVITTQSGD